MSTHKKSVAIMAAILFVVAAGIPTAHAAEAEAVSGKRYEIFMLNPLPGCNPTTITFRSDNIMVVGCMDGFGAYLPLGNFFVGFYRAPDFYLGRDITLLLSGFALDPVIIASGVAYVGDETRTVLAAGYLLGSL